MPGTISRLFGNVPSTSKKLPPPMGNPMAPDKDGGGYIGAGIRKLQGMMPAGAPAGQGPGINREALIARLNRGPTATPAGAGPGGRPSAVQLQVALTNGNELYRMPDGSTKEWTPPPTGPQIQRQAANPQGPLAMAQAPTDANAARQFEQTGKMPATTYSGSYRDQPLNKVAPAANREGILARLNRGAGVSLEQAATDPNFNKDGRMFQGAGLAVNPQGKAQFVDRTPRTFAGGAATEGDAARKRMLFQQRMETEGKGYYIPGQGFVGMAGKGGGEAGAANAAMLRDNPVAMRSRMMAGGNEPTTLTPDQLAANRQGMLARLQGRRDAAAPLVMQKAKEAAIARQQPQGGQGMNPFMERLMMQRPELAVAILGQQQQGQIAQAQMGLEGRRLDQQGQLAQAQLAAAKQARGEQLTHEEKLAVKKMEHDQNLQQGDLGFRQKALDQQGQIAGEDRVLRGKLGEMQVKAEQEAVAARERQAQAALRGGMAGKLLEQDDLTPDQRAGIADFGMGNVPAPGAGAAAQPGAPVGGIRGLLGGGGGKTFAGNTLTERQMKEVQGIDDPTMLRDKLASFGLTPQQQTVALNAIIPPTGVPGMLGVHTRSADNPGGWRNMLRGRWYGPKTGNITRDGNYAFGGE